MRQSRPLGLTSIATRAKNSGAAVWISMPLCIRAPAPRSSVARVSSPGLEVTSMSRAARVVDHAQVGPVLPGPARDLIGDEHAHKARRQGGWYRDRGRVLPMRPG